MKQLPTVSAMPPSYVYACSKRGLGFPTPFAFVCNGLRWLFV